MAHSYRALQQWNQWLTQQFLGGHLLEAEQNLLANLLDRHYGRHAVLIGSPNQTELLKATTIPLHSLVSPIMSQEKKTMHIEADLQELPLITGSIDLVLLPHTLELIDHPRQLLAEACRIIKPEGLIVICGFNPYSIWGIKKMLTKDKIMPWSGQFIHSSKIKSWLHLADFEMEKQQHILFRPPIHNKSTFHKFRFIERIGSKCFPIFGGVYVLLARAKVIPLTPIRLKWKQQLSGVRISTSMTGHIARH